MSASQGTSNSNNKNMSVIEGVQFDATSDIKYSKPSVNERGGKSVRILNKATGGATYLTTPLMLTWGANVYDRDDGSQTFDMSIQFPSDEYARKECLDFLENLRVFEEKLKADAITHSKEWLGKGKVTPEVIDALWTPMLRYPRNKDTLEPDYTRAPTLRIKIPFWEGKFKSEIFNEGGEPLFMPDRDDNEQTPDELLQKGSHVALLIMSGGLWFANGKFGTTWKLMQAMVRPKQSLRGKCQITLSSSSRDAMNKAAAAESEVEDTPTSSFDNVVADDDDEVPTTEDDVGEDTVEEVQEPAPVVEEKPKKRVRRVKKKAAA